LLLEKVEIPEKEGYGGFPVSGEWLVCKNEEITHAHDAKVYGMVDEGAPPMSCPHLDTRYINGKRELLFGPFAGFSTRFLKEGSRLSHLISTIYLPCRAYFGTICP
jgi:malate dehydrogenase (quinone)